MKSGKVEIYLALVRGLLPCVVGECVFFDSTVDRLEEGVCVIFCVDSGVSHTSQLSAVSISALLVFCPRSVVPAVMVVWSDGLRRKLGDFCAGASTPNSFQNEVEMSAGLVCLPDMVVCSLPREDDEDRDDLPGSRSRLRDLAPESRLRVGAASECDGDMVRD